MIPNAPFGPINTQAPLLPHPLNEGRVLWLYGAAPLDGGRTWWDLCGLSPATLVNGPTWATTPYGHSGLAMVAASSQRADVAPAARLNPTAAITVAATARFTTVATGTAQALVRKGFTSGIDLAYFLRQSAGGLVEGGVVNAAGSLVAPTGITALSANAWYRLAFTYDGSVVRLFLNGRQEIIVSQTGAIWGTTEPVTLGATRNVTGPTFLQFLDGTLADVSVWSRTLSVAEVLAEYDLSRRGYPGVLRRA